MLVEDVVESGLKGGVVCSVSIGLCGEFQIIASKASPPTRLAGRPVVDSIPLAEHAQAPPPGPVNYNRLRLVGRRKYFLWDRCHHESLLCRLEMGSRFQSGAQRSLRYWLGRSRGGRARFSAGNRIGYLQGHGRPFFPSALRQLWNCHGDEQGPFTQPGYEHSPKKRLPASSPKPDFCQSRICLLTRKYLRCSFSRRHIKFPTRFPQGFAALTNPHPSTFARQNSTMVTMMARCTQAIASSPAGTSCPPSQQSNAPNLLNRPVLFAASLQLLPSPLRPDCPSGERIHRWVGVNKPPPATIDHPVIERLAAKASEASLRGSTSHGAGLRKFHLFCDIFSVPESRRLPADFPLLHSFALWAATDPALLGLDPSHADTPFEPVSVGVVHKYLSAISRMAHRSRMAPPLSDEDHNRINWSLRGLANIQSARKHPIRPPITTSMLSALRSTLDISQPFDACVWAMATCAFWGMMRFGEVSVASRAKFSSATNITRENAIFDQDSLGKEYVRLDLPTAKTA
ncbi:hypothetical protein BD779DRAFT_1244082 [Infundibulicybe gibba]|nr:hypothetical protein BD779DRAFT_1244082 [Infundibulicybe gibba]